MSHVVLIGDSIFDNEAYVPDQEPVVSQLQSALTSDWRISLLAVDGDITTDVPRQLKKLPATASHLIISAGGNDALQQIGLFKQSVVSVTAAMNLFAEILSDFYNDYDMMLKQASTHNLPLAVCTVYDRIPEIPAAVLTGLALYNEIILKLAFKYKLPVIDLRLVCTEATDYSSVSPIEPSVQGGRKIVDVIAQVLANHDFKSANSTVYY